MKTKILFVLITILFVFLSCSPETDISEFQNNDEVQNTTINEGTTVDNDRED